MSSPSHEPDRRSPLLKYFSVVNTILLAVIAIMGLWLRSEFFSFADQRLTPIIERLSRESFERQMAVQKLESRTEQLTQALLELNESMRQMRQDLKKIYEEAVPGAR